MPTVTLEYHPLPIHIPVHISQAREKCAMGAVGSGKTIALCGNALEQGLLQAGSRIMIGRKTIARLKDTTEMEFQMMMSRIPDDAKKGVKSLWDTSEHYKNNGHLDRVILPNKTEYIFRGLEDWPGLMGLNLAGLYVDEASEITQLCYDSLTSRVRQTEPVPDAARQGTKWPARELVWQQIMLACNPNGQNWIWDYFVNNPINQFGLPREVFESTSFDNPFLFDESGNPLPYLLGLLNNPEMWKRRFLWCEYGAFSGQILAFDPEVNVHTAFMPPLSWERAMGLDWGLRSPTAVVWWARHPDTKVWHQYREWQTYDPRNKLEKESYVTVDVHYVAKKIKEIEAQTGEYVALRAADPAIAQRQASDGNSIDYWFRKHGLMFRPGLKQHEPRINALNGLLRNNELSIGNNCEMTIVANQQYRWEEQKTMADERDAPERPLKKDDHLVDAQQYLATLVWQSPQAPPKDSRTAEERDLEDFWKKVKKQVKKKSRKRTRDIGPE